MSYQATKRHWGTLNGYYSVKEASLKRLHIIIPTIWQCGKSKTMEAVTRSVGSRSLAGREGWTDGAKDVFTAAKISVWYYDGEYMSLYICQNP